MKACRYVSHLVSCIAAGQFEMPCLYACPEALCTVNLQDRSSWVCCRLKISHQLSKTNKGHKPSERAVQTQTTSIDNPKQEKWQHDTGGAHLLLLEAAYIQSDGADR